MNWKKVKNKKIANNILKEQSDTQKFNFTPKISKKSKELAMRRQFSSKKKKVEDRLFEISKKKFKGPPKRSTSYINLKRSKSRVNRSKSRPRNTEEVNFSFRQVNREISQNTKKVVQKKKVVKKKRVRRDINKSVSSTIFLQECEVQERKSKRPKRRKRKKQSEKLDDLARNSIKKSQLCKQN